MDSKSYTNHNKAIIIILFALVVFLCHSCTKEESSIIDLKQNAVVQNYQEGDILEIPVLYTQVNNTLKKSNASQLVKSVIVPIILIPKGSFGDSLQLLRVYQALENLRFWFKRELPDKDLHWDYVKILKGQHTAEYYRQNLNVWNEIPAEIETAFGWNPWKCGDVNHIALVMGKDLYGWAGGNGLQDGRGLSIIGLESLVDLDKVRNEWWGTQEFWHGTAIHELGHALTLGHSDDPSSIMYFHDDYKNKHLTSEEKVIVQSNPSCKLKGPKPIARWTFDEMTPDIVTDESGNDYPLYMRFGAVYGSGLIEGAAMFDGIDAIAETDFGICNINDLITLSVWLKPYKLDGRNTIICKWYAPDSYTLEIVDGYYEFRLAFPGKGWDDTQFVKVKASSDKWTHIICGYNGKKMIFCLNGKLNVSKEVSGIIQQSNRPVCIGNHPDWNSYRGLIDKIEIYDKALTPEEILTYHLK